MAKWKSVRVRQDLLEGVEEEVQKTQHQSLSEFVSEAIQLRLQELAKERVAEYLERDKCSRVAGLQTKLFYTSKHVCAQETHQGNVRIGITDYFQGRLKEIVNIQTDETGEKVTKDEPFGMVETWWFTHDLYCPLNGTVVSVNRKVTEDPFTLNEDPYQWIVEVQPEQTEANSWMNGLLTFEGYKKLVTKLEGQLQ